MFGFQAQSRLAEPEDKNRLAQGSSYVPPHMRNMTASPLPKNSKFYVFPFSFF